MHFASNSATSGWGHSTTIAQMPKVNHQHITQVWCCTGAPTSQGWWWPECSSTQGRWRSQQSSTPKGDFCGSVTVHRRNHIHKDSLADQFQWEVLDGWQSLETRDWNPGWSAGISRFSCCFTPCASIARRSISQNWSTNATSCTWLLCLLLLHWTYDDNPRNVHSQN